MKRCFVAFAVLLVITGLTSAQDDEKLQNPGLEEGLFGPYTTRRGGEFPIYLPNGWNVWLASPTGEFFNRGDRTTINPHPGPDPNPHESGRALSIDCGFVTCTTAIYQQVSVEPNTNVQASAWAQVKACNLPPGGDTCASAAESGAQTRIGIDPNGGTDPNDTDIVWSSWVQPHDEWQEMIVSATTSGSTATLFLYSRQGSAADLNRTYWDEASLTGGGEGGTAASSSGPAPVPTAPPAAASIVIQPERPDGSIVHVVSDGETMDAIALAYEVTRQQILELNNISDPRIINIGQELIIRAGLPTSGETLSEEVDENAEPTRTPAPAPVVSVADGRVIPAVDPSTLGAVVCVALFDDANQNRIQEVGEDLLAGGTLSLIGAGEVLDSIETDGVSEPHCFENLTPGGYIVAASPPDGYGLTSPDQLRLQALAGVKLDLNFGAAEGVERAAPPPADAGGLVSDAAATEPDTRANSLADRLRDNSGLIIFGMAAVVLLAGMGMTLLFRRR